MGRVVGAFSVVGDGEGLETGLARLDQVHARAIAWAAIHACRCRSTASRIRTDRRVLRCRPATLQTRRRASVGRTGSPDRPRNTSRARHRTGPTFCRSACKSEGPLRDQYPVTQTRVTSISGTSALGRVRRFEMLPESRRSKIGGSAKVGFPALPGKALPRPAAPGHDRAAKASKRLGLNDFLLNLKQLFSADRFDHAFYEAWGPPLRAQPVGGERQQRVHPTQTRTRHGACRDGP